MKFSIDGCTSKIIRNYKQNEEYAQESQPPDRGHILLNHKIIMRIK